MTWLILFFYLHYKPVSDANICKLVLAVQRRRSCDAGGGVEGSVWARGPHGRCTEPDLRFSDLKSHTLFMARPPSQACPRPGEEGQPSRGARAIHHVLVSTGQGCDSRTQILKEKKGRPHPLIQGVC